MKRDHHVHSEIENSSKPLTLFFSVRTSSEIRKSRGDRQPFIFGRTFVPSEDPALLYGFAHPRVLDPLPPFATNPILLRHELIQKNNFPFSTDRFWVQVA